MILDLELKRVPFEPGLVGDDFQGREAGDLEKRVVAEIARAGVVARTAHPQLRSSRRRRHQAAGTRTGHGHSSSRIPLPPRRPRSSARPGPTCYCPDYHFVEAESIRQAHADRHSRHSWTVNTKAEWETLASWGVDGITTDYPGGVGGNDCLAIR